VAQVWAVAAVGVGMMRVHMYVSRYVRTLVSENGRGWAGTD